MSRFTSLVFVLPLTFIYYPQELEKVNCELRETRQKMKDVERERQETGKEVEETREKQRKTERELERAREQLAGKETEARKSRKFLKDEIEKLKQHHLQEVCTISVAKTHTRKAECYITCFHIINCISR